MIAILVYSPPHLALGAVVQELEPLIFVQYELCSEILRSKTSFVNAFSLLSKIGEWESNNLEKNYCPMG